MAAQSGRPPSSRAASSLGIAKRRRLEQREQVDPLHDLQEIHPRIPGNLATPLFLAANAFDHSVHYELQHHVKGLDMTFNLVPCLGVRFTDVNGKFRTGIIRKVSEKSVSVFILYTKQTMEEVRQNVQFNSTSNRMINSLLPFQCFQSVYTDEVPVDDICGVFQINFEQFSGRGTLSHMQTSDSLPCMLCVGYLYFYANPKNRKEECQVLYFKKLDVSLDMLRYYFLNIRKQTDFFRLNIDLQKIRTTMVNWFIKRGKPFLKPRMKRVEFDVDLDEITSFLLLFKHLQPDDCNENICCTGLNGKGQCSWTISTSLLQNPVINREFPVPFKNEPYMLEPGSGSLYFEGPLTVTLKRNQRTQYTCISFKFERMVRLCMFHTEIWKHPD